KNAYPNPFKLGSSTTIEVDVKAGETGTLSIYNLSGQLVRSFTVNEGAHSLGWNGRDSKGAVCGSGIYFYKLSTASCNQSRKMVIIK
ncbi:MAG TPA: T9SS type A sorting domain-containing protein, partial [Candidatus Syntrophosphaera sp.]|nr:T9SS type A sorting domain-containing protein [Candidatus Syntrophosphaera sp.]HRT59950.1 T9SS type A sorting domain-containing protein [Candidatus Syntrophosphaera sp.]